MVKMYMAFTNQIDDPEEAVREVLEQLKLEENKLKNTIGIIHFYHEFVDTEVCKAVADALPFDVVGCVSAYVGTDERYADVALTVTVFTGDDVSFSVKAIDGISGKSKEQITEEVTRMCAELCAKEAPKLVMPFLSMGPYFSGDDLVDAVNALPEPFPLYGSIVFNTDQEKGHHVLVDGKISSDVHVYVAFYGNFEPKFHITTAFFDFQGTSADVTDAEGTVLKAVNGMTTLQYLREQGMVPADETAITASWTIPAILTYPNATQVVRAFPGLVEGTEFAWATGFIKTGARISFAHLDGDKTVASAALMIEKLVASKKTNVIIYSCAARAWSLGTEYDAEMKKIAECVKVAGAPFNFSLAYTGGEICPVWDKDGKMINILHNCTLTACAF
jgi:hypothetical protein